MWTARDRPLDGRLRPGRRCHPHLHAWTGNTAVIPRDPSGSVLLAPLIIILALFLSPSLRAEVEGNCIMCHQFPGIGRYETAPDGSVDTSKKHIFYINDKVFEGSYHGKLRCKSCHTGVDRYPHIGIPKVDCATDCHIMDPSVNKPFSHRHIVEDFKVSVHGVEGSSSADKTGLPVCKDCHTNKSYHTEIDSRIGTAEFLEICNECHQSEVWTKRFFEHMLYRSLKRRPSRDVIKLCSRCHMDQELMARHNLDVIAGFRETFHAKAISYGNEEVANCLNCHAPYSMGFSPHRIKSARDETSPVNRNNKAQTCRQSGCHEKAVEKFGLGGRVHPSPNLARVQGRTETAEVSDQKLQEDTAFEALVIKLIILFYKFLIAAVIGGFILHRSLDIYASRRERRMGSH